MYKDFEKIHDYLSLAEFANKVIIELGLCLELEKLSDELIGLCEEILEIIESTSNWSPRKLVESSSKKLIPSPDTLKVFRLVATDTTNDARKASEFWDSIKDDTIRIKQAKKIDSDIGKCLLGLMTTFNFIADRAIIEARRMREEPILPKLISWTQMA